MAEYGVLTREDIIRLCRMDPPLIARAIDLSQQVQPNGVDLTLRDINSFLSRGNLSATDRDRQLSLTEPLHYDNHGGIDLLPGAYLVTFNEIVSLPADIMALARPRSSLNRCGVSIHSAVWDAGYSGRSQSLLVVYNIHGFRLHRDARLLQLVFFRLTAPSVWGYSGRFQGENI